MIQENELIMLVLGLGLYFVVAAYKTQFRLIPGWNILLFAYRILLAAWFFTVLEGFFLAGAFNLLEHFCYAGSAVMMVFWCRRVILTGNTGAR